MPNNSVNKADGDINRHMPLNCPRTGWPKQRNMSPRRVKMGQPEMADFLGNCRQKTSNKDMLNNPVDKVDETIQMKRTLRLW